MRVTLTTIVDSCLNCPYRECDGEESYCGASDLDMFYAYTVYEENWRTLTESCPLIIARHEELK